MDFCPGSVPVQGRDRGSGAGPLGPRRCSTSSACPIVSVHPGQLWEGSLTWLFTLECCFSQIIHQYQCQQQLLVFCNKASCVNEEEGELLPLQQALVVSTIQMFCSLWFERLTIPVVLGLLCRTRDKIAVLLKTYSYIETIPFCICPQFMQFPKLMLFISLLSMSYGQCGTPQIQSL